MMSTHKQRKLMDGVDVDTEDDDSDKLGKLMVEKRGQSLLAVTTFCAKDLPLLRKRAEYMAHINCIASHDLLVIGDSDTDEHMVDEVRKIHLPFFRSVEMAQLKSNGSDSGWPKSVNRAFRSTVWLLHGIGKIKFNTKPFRGWLYFESDITPLVPDFMRRLEQEYVNMRKPFMGITGDIKSSSGKTVKCMNGAGIYPFGMGFFNQEMMLTDNIPWDVAGLSGNTLRLVHNMGYDKYAMHFSTWEYNQVGERSFTCIKRRHAGPEEPDKCTLTAQWIHHGCKDGTMIDLLMGKEKPPIVVTPPEPVKKSGKTGYDEAAIIADHKDGMKWQALIGKYKIAPKVLKSILPAK